MKVALAWLKFAFSLCLLLLIFYKLSDDGLATLWQQLNGISWLVLATALLLQLASTITAAYRWLLIQRWLGDQHADFFYIKSYFKGALFNQLLPTSIGGDAYRIIENGQRIGSHKEAFFGVFIDRVAGLLGLLLLNALALWWLPDLLPKDVSQVIAAILVIGLVGAVFGLLLHKLPNWCLPLWSSLQKLSRRFAQVYRSPSSIGIQLGLSMLTHLFSMLVLMTLGQGLGLDFGLWVYLVMIPPVILLTLLPLSFAGWGIREGAMIGLFALIGAPNELIFALSILYGLTLIIASLPGLFFFTKDKGFFYQQPTTASDTEQHKEQHHAR